MSISQKLWLILGASWAVAASGCAFLLVSAHSTAARYDSILQSEVALQGSARAMQVAFKKEVQEWKDMLLRGSDEQQFTKYSTAFQAQQAVVNEQAEALLGQASDPAIQDLAQNFRLQHRNMGEKYAAGIASFQAAGRTNMHEVDSMVKGQDRAPTNLIDQIVDKAQENVQRGVSVTHAAVGRDRVLSLIGLLVVFAALIGISARVIRALVKTLTHTVGTLSSSVSDIASSADALSESTQGIADAATKQASLIEETSASSTEVSATAKSNLEHTAQVTGMMREVSDRVAAGLAGMTELLTAMQSIQEASDNIGNIMKSIDGIAFQTNILALNAAIEAARAGDAGLGFSVVADEVRVLAHRSSEAARNTSDLIAKCVQSVQTGNAKASQAYESITGVTGVTERVASLLNAVQSACKEQTLGMQVLSQAMVQNESAAQAAAAGAEEGAAATEELSAQAAGLRALMLELKQMV